MVDDGMLTVGKLARRTGMSAKLIRRLTDIGLIYSPGRSVAGYRLYDQSAIWCVEVITKLRSLGFTIDEVERLADAYLRGQDGELRHLFEDMLDGARRRVSKRIGQLEEVRARQDQALAGSADLRSMAASDPTRT